MQLKIVSKLKIYLSLLFLFPSDEQEKELEIKLDITKKSRKINRPVQFHDQHGGDKKTETLREQH